ncbi:putative neutral cholesterol ester hydrolase 1 [Apostichopus japonicus]|uniref:Putative neutral cholesterol ester hydrolase 1 n=1 Tax=Stichopus japonicus TaxID=307972 RepID=A0A2G8JJM2_STIJA|nr:putative neutral cholesterol ester hydrolase 1 [Apostichopus japonicus]
MGRFLLCLAIGCALLAYILNPSVPDGIEERWKYRLVAASFKLYHLVGVAYSVFTSGDQSANVAIATQAAVCLALDHVSTEHEGPGVIRTRGNFNGTRVYIYQPPQSSDELLPGFIYFHGGGLSMGTALSFDGIARKISSRLNALVVNVDYDNTPKNKFPGPIRQAFAAVKWFLLHAREYGVDPRRIAVGGDSAGGYLSATVSHLVHDDKTLPELKLQILIYPWTQCLDFHFPSYQKYTKEFEVGEGIVCREGMIMFCALHAWGSARPELFDRMMTNSHVGPSFKKSALYQQTLAHGLLPDSYRNSSYYEGPSPSDQGDEEFWKTSKEIFLDPRFTPHFRKNMTGLRLRLRWKHLVKRTLL